MRLTAVRVDAKKEAVDADKTVSMNANIMKEDIEKYAELTDVYSEQLPQPFVHCPLLLSDSTGWFSRFRIKYQIHFATIKAGAALN